MRNGKDEILVQIKANSITKGDYQMIFYKKTLRSLGPQRFFVRIFNSVLFLSSVEPDYNTKNQDGKWNDKDRQYAPEKERRSIDY